MSTSPHWRSLDRPLEKPEPTPERIDYAELRNLIGPEVITRHDFDSHIESCNVDVERRTRYENQVEHNQR